MMNDVVVMRENRFDNAGNDACGCCVVVLLLDGSAHKLARTFLWGQPPGQKWSHTTPCLQTRGDDRVHVDKRNNYSNNNTMNNTDCAAYCSTNFVL